MRAVPLLFLTLPGFVTVGVSLLSASEPGRGTYESMDYGPVIAETIRVESPEGNVARKGLAIRLEHDAAVIFDTALMRYAAGTAGGWIDLSNTSHTSYKGSASARSEGEIVFATAPLPGWAKEGSFEDPRPDPGAVLPPSWARYGGYFRHEDTVVLSYTVGATEVKEWPSAIRVGETTAFVRTIWLEPSPEAMSVYLAQVSEEAELAFRGATGLVAKEENRALAVYLIDAVEGASIEVKSERNAVLHLPAREEPVVFRVALAGLKADGARGFDSRLNEVVNPEIPDTEGLTHGGPLQWEGKIYAEGQLGQGTEAYVVDNIPVPEENPWNSWMRLSGFDFFSDATRAAVSTWNGDVWIVSGLDESLENVRWKRFASGLYFPMGIAIVDDLVHVTERGQLTRLHDLNGNGEADFYENFNNDGVIHPMAHSLELQQDSAGNFYFFKNGNRVSSGVPEHGALIRVSRDGSRHEVFANGFRGNNSLAISPDDSILTADQEGNWVPATRLDFVRQDRFYGYRPHGGEDLPVGEFEPPVAWIPHSVDNSSGGQAYVDSGEWGPLQAKWVHTSYGTAELFFLVHEAVGGQVQGGLVKLPLSFSSGLMRTRFSPYDGQLYLLGMRGWQTVGPVDSSFDRVRYTGKPAYLPVALNATSNGIRLIFSDPLDPESASKAENYSVQRWNYIYSSRYGSPEMSVADPEREGRDSVPVSSATVSPDGKTVFLEIPGMKPVMQMKVAYRLESPGGDPVENEIHHTVHQLAGAETGSFQTVLLADDDEGEVSGEAAPYIESSPDFFDPGKSAYQVYCAACHGAEGVSGSGIAPSLVDSSWIDEGAEEALIRIVLQGKQGGSNVMTPFGWLSDEQIASILTYIRGDREPNAIGAEAVNAVREATSGRTSQWSDDELREFLQ
ncbi:MAG: DUF6797 domain-containing protein [Opitutales bacterium]